MPLFRGTSRFCQAVRLAIAGSPHGKIAPFFTLDMEQIPAFREPDRIASTSPHFIIEFLENESASYGQRPRLSDSEHNALGEIVARAQAPNVESPTDPSNGAESISTVSLAVHEQAIADKDAIEAAIRREADPKGVYKRDTVDTAGLVKYIRKRHRDALDQNEKDKNAMRDEKENMQRKFDEEKDRLNRIIGEKNEALRSKDEEHQQRFEDLYELKNKYSDLQKDNEAKGSRITELEEKVTQVRQTCETVTNGSVRALKLADRRMQYRVTRIDKKHQEELDVIRGWNNTLQDRLNIARRLQPVYIFDKVQVSTVREMREKLVQVEKSKKEELSTKEDEIKKLGIRIKRQEREIHHLKTEAGANMECLESNTERLSDSQKALEESKSRTEWHQREVERLSHRVNVWVEGYDAQSQEIKKLKIELFTLRAGQRDELIELQAKNRGLQASVDHLQELNDRVHQELESWENGNTGSSKAPEPKTDGALPGTVAESLSKALKAANARANTLQMSVNALQAENGVLRTQSGSSAYASNPQVQEQFERLHTENRELREAAREAESLKAQLTAQFAEEVKRLEEGFNSRTRELELGFDQGFESLRALRYQWILQKRRLEEDHNRVMVAANLRQETDRQDREDRFMATCKEKETKLQQREDDLQRREKNLSLAHSSSQDLVDLKNRAQQAEDMVLQLRLTATNGETRRNLIEQNLNGEIASLRREGQRHLDLLQEETSKMAEGSRLTALHQELQIANCNMQFFRYGVENGETDSQTRGKDLHGAGLYESDVRLLQDQGRPVLLAQLQAAKRTLEQLRNLVAEGPNVDKDKAVSILVAPRGDENVGPPDDDFFADSNETQLPIQQPSSRKRPGAPLGNPKYGGQDDSFAYDDSGCEAITSGAKISTVEEILNRRMAQPKSRHTVGPANPAPPQQPGPANS